MPPTQTPSTAPSGRRRRTLAPVSAEAESLHQLPQQQRQPHPPQQFHEPQDPPIFRSLLTSWADRGRTLPGRHDPEWARLVAPTVRTGQFSGSPGPRGGGR
ncbi:hypothetical protein OFY01_02845 [Streptomyces sp. GXMU-J5]|uniref:Uncharacterized protein n=1 Tax=Streptomyces beihaiensis TaxID=2984495 RepID=A0ABT3TRS0_9ACTN|nr:hypothetical protein [Streptomyces beihaiensis]MCX3058723.1 hypothetical protein [Streptomyces beihaiensis]